MINVIAFLACPLQPIELVLLILISIKIQRYDNSSLSSFT